MHPSIGQLLVFLTSIPFILIVTLQPAWQSLVAKILPSEVQDGDSFDFIVVGSGSAGSVVAARLAEAGLHVLLVEAGGQPSWLMPIPALLATSQGTAYDWKFATEPQKHTMHALKDSVCKWARGKVLGGTSQLNAMLYVRGHARDYDEWSSMGNPGWSYKEVLPFFKKSERFYGDAGGEEIDPEYHGKDGPMGVRIVTDVTKITEVFEEAFEEVGMKRGDYNGKEQEVFFRGQTNQNNGRRGDTFSNFAEPHVGKGITLLTYAHVTKVLFKPNTNEAIGIRVTRFDQELSLYASKEVILSGGSVGSPHILMLSGIGPTTHLESLGIKTKVDLPGRCHSNDIAWHDCR